MNNSLIDKIQKLSNGKIHIIITASFLLCYLIWLIPNFPLHELGHAIILASFLFLGLWAKSYKEMLKNISPYSLIPAALALLTGFLYRGSIDYAGIGFLILVVIAISLLFLIFSFIGFFLKNNYLKRQIQKDT